MKYQYKNNVHNLKKKKYPFLEPLNKILSSLMFNQSQGSVPLRKQALLALSLIGTVLTCFHDNIWHLKEICFSHNGGWMVMSKIILKPELFPRQGTS